MDDKEPAVPDPTGRELRIRDLAALMRNRGDSPGDGLTVEEARAAGFTLAEIATYRDEAALLARYGAGVSHPPLQRRMCGDELVRQARALRQRRSAEP